MGKKRVGYANPERFQYGPFLSNRGQLTQTGESRPDYGRTPEGKGGEGAGKESRRDFGERMRGKFNSLPAETPKED